MNIVTSEIEDLAEDNGLCISEVDGFIKVYNMTLEEEPLLAEYYNGDFREALNDVVAEIVPGNIETEAEAELLIEILINEVMS